MLPDFRGGILVTYTEKHVETLNQNITTRGIFQIGQFKVLHKKETSFMAWHFDHVRVY